MAGQSNYSASAIDLGLGDMLRQQTKDETDEQRRKRLAQLQMPGGMSPSAVSLLGGYGGAGA